jgi:hypothetical protein
MLLISLVMLLLSLAMFGESGNGLISLVMLLISLVMLL